MERVDPLAGSQAGSGTTWGAALSGWLRTYREPLTSWEGLATLGATDRYAKESVCEEIQITDFVNQLIGNLGSPGREAYGKSREILRIMESLGYGTPLREYLKSGPDERIRKELTLIVRQEVAS